MSVKEGSLLWREYVIPGSREVRILDKDDDYNGLIKLVSVPHCDMRGPSKPRKYACLQLIIATLAGSLAERRVGPSGDPGCVGDDRAIVEQLAAGSCTETKDGTPLFFGCDLWRDAEDAVAYYWPQIEAVAAALLREKTLDGQRLREVILSCKQGGPSYPFRRGAKET